MGKTEYKSIKRIIEDLKKIRNWAEETIEDLEEIEKEDDFPEYITSEESKLSEQYGKE